MAEENFPDIKFGTSGLRGPAEGFTQHRIYAFIRAFLEATDDISACETVFLASDLRKSSPTIVAACSQALHALGWTAHHLGNIPTPALAHFAMSKNCPSLMVTGSHIPESQNGIKFYRRDGELKKSDEHPILDKVKNHLGDNFQLQPASALQVDPQAAISYKLRYTSTFSHNALQGLRIGVDLHSAVGGDLLTEIVQALGAACFPFAKSHEFVAVDTEALGDARIKQAHDMIQKYNLDCVISTDGDGDRPMLIAETGTQITGDVLGAITARVLGIKCVVTPLSSTSAVEESKWFAKTIRTKIGSPYVVAAMELEAQNEESIAGFEANGGFLLGSSVALARGTLSPLPTRDAVLPLIIVLGESKKQGISISNLAQTLPQRYMQADRLQNVSNKTSDILLKKIKSSAEYRAKITPLLANLVSVNNQDGIRMTISDSSIIHFRQSGNSPELRCYVETESKEKSAILLAEIMKELRILVKNAHT